MWVFSKLNSEKESRPIYTKKIYVTKTLNSYIYDGKNINGHNLLINVINKLPLTYLNGSFYKQVKMLKKIVTVHQVYWKYHMKLW